MDSITHSTSHNQSNSDNQFVFVVCGAQEHIDTLHYSLKALKRYSRNDIVVVTDVTRNAVPVVWHDIVDIRTPAHLNHHQASIYLKTSLYRYLPTGRNYCYLDTDVVAIGNEVDTIFAHKAGPITFAADHSRMNWFSPYAVRCGCVERHLEDKEEVQALLKLLTAPPGSTQELTPLPEPLQPSQQSIRVHPQHNLVTIIRRIFSPRTFQDNAYSADQYENKDALQEEVIQAASPSLNSTSIPHPEWKWDADAYNWKSPNGRITLAVWPTYALECSHLIEWIDTKFGIQVTDSNWQHWNGGVFLFDDDSHAFLDAWHQKTMAIFEDPTWKTRDQGTLIATVWEFGLQNAPVLSTKFNFIADHGTSSLALSADRTHITNDNFVTSYIPQFIHVFYHFGDTEWDIWNWINERAGNL